MAITYQRKREKSSEKMNIVITYVVSTILVNCFVQWLMFHVMRFIIQST